MYTKQTWFLRGLLWLGTIVLPAAAQTPVSPQGVPGAPYAVPPEPYGVPVAPAVIPVSYCDDCGTAGTCACEPGLWQRYSRGGWGSVEYLLWWGKERALPPLMTTSPQGTLEGQAGRLGLPTTTILFGNDEVGGDPESGVRIEAGAWLDAAQSHGWGARFTWIDHEVDFSAASNEAGDPILARPFFNTDLGDQDALLAAFPGVSHGTVSAAANTEYFGVDVLFRKHVASAYCNRLDVVGGYQFSQVEDSVVVQNRLISDDPARLPLGSTIDTRDQFEARNEFHGGFLGLMASAEDGRLSWRTLAKIGFGNVHQEARISGSTVSAIPGPGGVTEAMQDFGLLALPSNIGRMDDDEFAFIPELNLSVGYRVNRHLQVTLGYSLIYWSEMALAGELIDTTINPTQMVGPLIGANRPTATLVSDDFWMTGLSIGGALTY